MRCPPGMAGGDRRVADEGDGQALEGGHVDQVATSGAPAGGQGADRAERTEGPDRPLGQSAAHGEGYAVVAPVTVQGAGQGLEEEVRGLLAATWAAQAEGREAHHHQLGVAHGRVPGRRLPAEHPPARSPKVETMTTSERCGQRVADIVGRGARRVDHQALLRRGQVPEERPVLVSVTADRTRRRPGAEAVPFGPLDLGHRRPGVGQQLGAVGTGDVLGQVEDPQPTEAGKRATAHGISGVPSSPAAVARARPSSTRLSSRPMASTVRTSRTSSGRCIPFRT